MSRRQKCQLIGMFSLGGFFIFPPYVGGELLIVLSVCVASIIRVPYIAHISLVDQSWSDVYGVIWSVVGQNLGIVSAYLPTLPLFLHVFHGGYPAFPTRQKSGEKPILIAEDRVLDVVSVTESRDITPMVVLKK